MRRGFTLLELMVVVVILGLMAGVAAISARGSIEAARINAAHSTWRSFDHLMRERSSQDRSSLTLDVRPETNFAEATEAGLSCSVPIARIEIAGGDGGSFDDHDGSLVRFFADGSSDSYAIGFGVSDKVGKWLFIAGGTGQIVECRGSRHASELLRLAVR